MGKGGTKAGFHVMLKYFEINQSFMCSNLFRYDVKQIYSISRDGSDEKFVLFLVAANQRRERCYFTIEK